MIESLIQLKLKYNEILEKSCNKENNISIQIKKSFEDFINKTNTISILLAKYIDYFFRNEVKGMNDFQIST